MTDSRGEMQSAVFEMPMVDCIPCFTNRYTSIVIDRPRIVEDDMFASVNDTAATQQLGQAEVRLSSIGCTTWLTTASLARLSDRIF